MHGRRRGPRRRGSRVGWRGGLRPVVVARSTPDSASAPASTAARPARVGKGASHRPKHARQASGLAPVGDTHPEGGDDELPEVRARQLRGDVRAALAGRCPSATTSRATCATSTTRDRLAMVWEDWKGHERRVSFGELQRALEPLRQPARGGRRGARRPRGHAAALAARDGRRVHRHLQARRDPALAVGALRGRRHPAPAERLGRHGRGHRRGEPPPHPRRHGGEGPRDGRRGGRAATWTSTPGWSARATSYEMADTLADDPAQLYYSSGTTGKAKGILHAHRYLLAHEEFEFCHDVRDGELFHGSGEWAWAAGHRSAAGPVALRRGGARAGAQGRLRPRGAPALPREARRGEHVHHAHGAAGDDRRGGRR